MKDTRCGKPVRGQISHPRPGESFVALDVGFHELVRDQSDVVTPSLQFSGPVVD